MEKMNYPTQDWLPISELSYFTWGPFYHHFLARALTPSGERCNNAVEVVAKTGS